MRAPILLPLAFASMALGGNARAAGIVVPDHAPAHYEAYNSPRIEEPWRSEQPDARLTERPIGELISRELGLVDGKAELFRYQVEGAPSNKTVLDGAIGGGGIRLKLTW
jgi:hypothetical protein